MDMKKLMNSIRLVIADEERDQTRAVDELMLPKIEEARQLVSMMRGVDVLKGVVALRKSGLSFTADIKLKDTRPTDESAKSNRFRN
ncbi:MAG: hypothetical protein HYU74_13205 [Dechloromonas sp.]|nr:hypothetical protein [Dechloromonas sp.]